MTMVRQVEDGRLSVAEHAYAMSACRFAYYFISNPSDDMEKLRKQMQVTISELSEDNERIRLSLKTTKANFEKSREECEDLRAQLAGAPSPQGA